MGTVDELVWSDAQLKAECELASEFGIEGPIDEYYKTMCPVGKQLLADKFHRRNQKLYDYQATKMF